MDSGHHPGGGVSCVHKGRRLYLGVRQVDAGICPPYKAKFSRKCWHLVKADFTSHTLSLRTFVGTTLADVPLEVAKDCVSKYAFAIILQHSGDAVKLLPVTPQDQALLP